MSSRQLTRRAALLGAVGLVALCGVAFAIGAHAAIGDDDGPAVLMAHPGLLPGETDDAVAQPGSGEAGRAGAGDGDRADAGPTPPGPTPPVGSTRPPGPAPWPTPTHPSPSTGPTDPMSPKYNPYTTPGDPAYVDDEARSAWLGRQAVVRQCMADAGFAYLDWLWWEGGSPMPAGLDDVTETAWMRALRGDVASDPSSSWQESGCEGVAWHAAEEAAEAGVPLTAPVPLPSTGPTQREQWLVFQDAVRACMTAAGFEYRYWEFWNPAYPSTGGPAAMPPGLDDLQRAAWNTAAFGAPDGTGADLDAGGCWTTGVEATGYAEFG